MRKIRMGPWVLSTLISAASFSMARPAIAASCTVPNLIANGQMADASKVMDNFNSILSCANSAITSTGTPTVGSIAVFTSTNSVQSGDLSGDVTTNGNSVTNLASTGVAPGSYTAANIVVDAKGRITEASNGTVSGAAVRDLGANTTLNPSTSNYSAKGSMITAFEDVTILGLIPFFAGESSGTFVGYVASLGSDGTISAILAQSNPTTTSVAMTGFIELDFPTPYFLRKNERVAIIVARTDAIGNGALLINNPPNNFYFTNAPINCDGFRTYNSAIAVGLPPASSQDSYGQGYWIGVKASAS